MGEVYRARDTRLDRIVAIKVLSAARGKDLRARRRFEQEARAVSREIGRLLEAAAEVKSL